MAPRHPRAVRPTDPRLTGLHVLIAAVLLVAVAAGLLRVAWESPRVPPTVTPPAAVDARP